MNGAAVEAARKLVSGVAEHRDHVGVLAQYLGLELGESVLGGRTGEVFEQDRAQAAALMFVGHHERDLGGVGSAVDGQSLVDAHRDDVVGQYGHDRHPVVVVDRGHPRHLACRQSRRGSEIPHVAGAFGQSRMEADEPVGVVGHDRPQMHDATVRGEDVGDPVPRIVPGASAR